MADEPRATPRWLDLLWLLFLVGLALLPPATEPHKLIILAIIGAFQLVENRVIQASPQRGRYYVVLVKLGLATILLNHTQEVAINWIAKIMGAGSEAATFTIDAAGISELLMRILFFFLVGMIVNRFVMEYRIQVSRYQALAETLSEANRSLKQAQAEARRAERLAALGQLSAGLAHEIRNPLGVIKGSAEILNQKLGEGDALAKELAGYIYTEVNRLSALVSRFLDFARPSRLDLRSHELTAVIEKSLKTIVDQGAATNVTIERDYASNLPPVMLDEELCDQVFTNLFLNACQAMGDSGGTLHVKVAYQTRVGVTTDIQDTGPGIAPEMKEQIFNPFVTTKKSGVGLGLAIVSKIVDAHGGSVRVVSEPEQRGACFRVVFPAAVRVDN